MGGVIYEHSTAVDGTTRQNPGTTVHLDVDQHQRFFRGFIAFGVNIQSQRWLLLVFGFDGAHSKYKWGDPVVNPFA